MVEKERVICEATDCFIRYGIKGVGMDMIADALRISKRTLYFKFADKEELIVGCVDREVAGLVVEVEGIEAQASTETEALVMIFRFLSSYLDTICPAFFRDLVRYNKVIERVEIHKMSFRDKLEGILKRGIQSGCFVDNTDCSRIACVFAEQLDSVRSEHLSTTIMTLVRGICTDKGASELEELQENN